jgi:hypothetical protein
LNKKIEVTTNDPTTPSISLIIKGTVDSLYTLSPSRVRLEGFQGEIIKQTATLVTKEKYPLHITSVGAKIGDSIQYKLSEEKEGNATKYQLTVESTRKDAGRFIDTLVLKTDYSTIPEITIPVYGFIKTPAAKPKE